jgi:hypothetical protein
MYVSCCSLLAEEVPLLDMFPVTKKINKNSKYYSNAHQGHSWVGSGATTLGCRVERVGNWAAKWIF